MYTYVCVRALTGPSWPAKSSPFFYYYYCIFSFVPSHISGT